MFRRAFEKKMPSLSEIEALINAEELPVAQNYTGEERKAVRFYDCLQDKRIDGVNQFGWRLAHIQAIGNGKLNNDKAKALPVLERHFKLFLSPHNMVLVPSEIGAFAEVKSVLTAFVQDAEEAAIAGGTDEP